MRFKIQLAILAFILGAPAIYACAGDEAETEAETTTTETESDTSKSYCSKKKRLSVIFSRSPLLSNESSLETTEAAPTNRRLKNRKTHPLEREISSSSSSPVKSLSYSHSSSDAHLVEKARKNEAHINSKKKEFKQLGKSKRKGRKKIKLETEEEIKENEEKKDIIIKYLNQEKIDYVIPKIEDLKKSEIENFDFMKCSTSILAEAIDSAIKIHFSAMSVANIKYMLSENDLVFDYITRLSYYFSEKIVAAKTEDRQAIIQKTIDIGIELYHKNNFTGVHAISAIFVRRSIDRLIIIDKDVRKIEYNGLQLLKDFMKPNNNFGQYHSIINKIEEDFVPSYLLLKRNLQNFFQLYNNGITSLKSLGNLHSNNNIEELLLSQRRREYYSLFNRYQSDIESALDNFLTSLVFLGNIYIENSTKDSVILRLMWHLPGAPIGNDELVDNILEELSYWQCPPNQEALRNPLNKEQKIQDWTASDLITFLQRETYTKLEDDVQLAFLEINDLNELTVGERTTNLYQIFGPDHRGQMTELLKKENADFKAQRDVFFKNGLYSGFHIMDYLHQSSHPEKTLADLGVNERIIAALLLNMHIYTGNKTTYNKFPEPKILGVGGRKKYIYFHK